MLTQMQLFDQSPETDFGAVVLFAAADEMYTRLPIDDFSKRAQQHFVPFDRTVGCRIADQQRARVEPKLIAKGRNF